MAERCSGGYGPGHGDWLVYCPFGWIMNLHDLGVYFGFYCYICILRLTMCTCLGNGWKSVHSLLLQLIVSDSKEYE